MNGRRRMKPWLAAFFMMLGTHGALLARDSDPPASLYHLDAALTDQAGKPQGLDVYRGHPVLVTMFYASCKATCPLIVDTLRATEKKLTPAQRDRLRVLMVSIDPERDTPQALQRLAAERHIDTARWTLVRGDAEAVRDIAALLNVQYRKLPSGEFSHSTVIALLSPQGEVLASSGTLGGADPALLAKIPN
jgi:protein SCO1/2